MCSAIRKSIKKKLFMKKNIKKCSVYIIIPATLKVKFEKLIRGVLIIACCGIVGVEGSFPEFQRYFDFTPVWKRC